MITLNSEQGLIDVTAWEDIEMLPGFRPDLNPTDHKLKAIVGRYLFPDKIRCGLSNCHTPHAKGYVVATECGLKTNIGKDCGKTYFGVDFETLSRQFDRDVTARDNRRALESFSFGIEELEHTIRDLRDQDRGASWVNKHAKALVSVGQGCPEPIVRKLNEMIRTGASTLTLARQATEGEAASREAMQGKKLPRPQIIEDRIADIAGLQALYPENDLRTLLSLNLDVPLSDFKQLNIDTLAHEELRHWSQWVGTVDATIDKARAAVYLGRSLLARSNLEPLLKVLASKEDLAKFRAYLRLL